MSGFYYKFMGDVIGPISVSELKKRVEIGQINAETHIRKGENGQWITADRIIGLIPKPTQDIQVDDNPNKSQEELKKKEDAMRVLGLEPPPVNASEGKDLVENYKTKEPKFHNNTNAANLSLSSSSSVNPYRILAATFFILSGTMLTFFFALMYETTVYNDGVFISNLDKQQDRLIAVIIGVAEIHLGVLLAHLPSSSKSA
jgi:hypothetical protein